jgi:hypothetical protein
MKKYLLSFVLGLMLLGASASVASASSFSLTPSMGTGSTMITAINCSGIDRTIWLYKTDGTQIGHFTHADSGDGNSASYCWSAITSVLPFTYSSTFTAINPPASVSAVLSFDALAVCNLGTKTACLTNTDAVDLGTIFTYHVSPPPTAISHWSGFLGGTAPSIGTPYTGTVMNGQTATAVQSTINGIGPVLALVVGIFLAGIIVYRLLGLWQAPAQEIGDGKRLVRKSMGIYIRE